MFNLKVLAILLLSSQLALAALEVNVEEPASWPSVWQQQEVNVNVDEADVDISANKNHILSSVPVAASITIKSGKLPQERSADCSASSAKVGLGRLLREAESLLPLHKIQQLIVDSVANDQQVYALVDLQHSEALRKRAATIKQSLEYRILRDYACRQLNLDVTEMWSFVKSFISLTKEQVKPSGGEFNGRPGISGLLQDIRSILPRQHLKDLYQQLIEQDPQLKATVQRLQSSEFRQLLRNVRRLPESQELRKQLLNVGVPLMELKELINVALGWAGDEFGDNGEDWKV